MKSLVDLASSIAAALTRPAASLSALDPVTTAGAAMSVAPIQFMVRQTSPLEIDTCTSNRTPKSCTNGSCSQSDLCCSDGYTAFCCQLAGGDNYGCPSYAFIGGWWRCTQTITSGMCSSNGTRYYIDCNVTPGSSCPNGCDCAGNTNPCSKRRTCCNCFRYGQCNADISGTTYVVCRLLSCVKPDQPGLACADCTGPSMNDDTTCNHPDQTPCL